MTVVRPMWYVCYLLLFSSLCLFRTIWLQQVVAVEQLSKYDLAELCSSAGIWLKISFMMLRKIASSEIIWRGGDALSFA